MDIRPLDRRIAGSDWVIDIGPGAGEEAAAWSPPARRRGGPRREEPHRALPGAGAGVMRTGRVEAAE